MKHPTRSPPFIFLATRVVHCFKKLHRRGTTPDPNSRISGPATEDSTHVKAAKEALYAQPLQGVNAPKAHRPYLLKVEPNIRSDATVNHRQRQTG
jgi:hypothetical protein